jgi:hypothetical protein
MCFFIQFKNRKLLIAEIDIVCYKSGFVVDVPSFTKTGSKGLISDCKKHLYRAGKKQTKVELKKQLGFNENGNWDISIIINEGYHSYSTNKLPFFVQAECIIPKGTKYYYNDKYNHYVSETIMLKKCF